MARGPRLLWRPVSWWRRWRHRPRRPRRGAGFGFSNLDVTWASAVGCSNPLLVQAYSTSNSVSWTTNGLAPGSYRFSVWVRDASSAGARGNQFGTWDTYNNNTVITLT